MLIQICLQKQCFRQRWSLWRRCKEDIFNDERAFLFDKATEPSIRGDSAFHIFQSVRNVLIFEPASLINGSTLPNV